MDPVSIAASISSLIIGSTKIVQLANNLRQQYADSELLMASIAAECSTVTVALAQLHSALQSRHERSWKRDGKEDVLKSVEAVSIACALTLSVLEKYMMGANNSKEGEGESGASRTDGKLTRSDKVKIVWNDEEITRLLSQLRGYQSSLSLLLNVVQCQSDAEIRSLLIDNKIAMNLILRALNNLDIDSISMSGVTIQIEDNTADDDYEKPTRILAIEDDTTQSVNVAERSTALSIESSNMLDYSQKSLKDELVGSDKDIDDIKSARATTFDSIISQQDDPAPKRPKKSRNKPSISMFFDSIKIRRKPAILNFPLSTTTTEPGDGSPGPTPTIELNGIVVDTGPAVECIKVFLIGEWLGGYSTIFKVFAPQKVGDELYTTPIAALTLNYTFDEKSYEVGLYFATDMTDYERVRQLYYADTDLFLFCMATEYAHTMDDLMTYWLPEVEMRPNKKPGAQSILLCLNDHIRKDPEAMKTLPNASWGQAQTRTALSNLQISPSKSTGENILVDGVQLIDNEKAEKLAKEMGAIKYIVCKGTSSEADIKEMFEEALTTFIHHKTQAPQRSRFKLF